MASGHSRARDWYVAGNGNSSPDGYGWRWFGLTALWMPWLEPDMQIKVQILWTGKTLNLDVNSKDTMATVKARIQNKEGIPPDQQLIEFTDHGDAHHGDATMEMPTVRQFNRRALSDFNILKESTVRLFVEAFIVVILPTDEILKIDKV